MPSALVDALTSTSTGLASSAASPNMTTSNSNNNNNDNNNNNNTMDSTVAAIFEKKRVQKNIPGVSDGPHAYRHPYWFVCHSLPPSYWNYDTATIDYNEDVSPYELVQKIGRGKYSEVFLALQRVNGCFCVLKILKPVRLRKIKREITILQNLCGGPNVVRLLDVLYDSNSTTPVLVTEFVPEPCTLRSLMLDNILTNFDLRYYMYEVLRTLEFAHSRGIFHRDIKPHNIMINHERRFLRVIDWGLAEYYIHGEPLNCGVATRHYKGPELVLGYRHYDYSLDIWCVGCVLAGLLFRMEPLFTSSSNEDHLVKLVTLFGSAELSAYVRKYKCEIPSSVRTRVLSMSPNRLKWTKLIPKGPEGAWCDATALDLVDKMLQFDHANRITAAEAMAHPFFAPVRAALCVGDDGEASACVVREKRSGSGRSETQVEASHGRTETSNNNNNNRSGRGDTRGNVSKASSSSSPSTNVHESVNPLSVQTSASGTAVLSSVGGDVTPTRAGSTRAAGASAWLTHPNGSNSSSNVNSSINSSGGRSKQNALPGVATSSESMSMKTYLALQEQYPRRKKYDGHGGAGNTASRENYMSNAAESSDWTSSSTSSSSDNDDGDNGKGARSGRNKAPHHSMSFEQVYAIAAKRR